MYIQFPSLPYYINMIFLLSYSGHQIRIAHLLVPGIWYPWIHNDNEKPIFCSWYKCEGEEVLWCITVFHYCHLVYRQKLVTIVRCHLWIGINYTKWKESCDNVCDIYFRVETIVYITTAVIITKCVSNSSYCKLIHFPISVTTWMEG